MPNYSEIHVQMYELLPRQANACDRSGNILSFLLPLFQEGQLSVTGESICTKYWLTAKEV